MADIALSLEQQRRARALTIAFGLLPTVRAVIDGDHNRLTLPDPVDQLLRLAEWILAAPAVDLPSEQVDDEQPDGEATPADEEAWDDREEAQREPALAGPVQDDDTPRELTRAEVLDQRAALIEYYREDGDASAGARALADFDEEHDITDEEAGRG